VPSIIVPARDNAQFTATCLASLLFSVSRLNLNCEFILVDDASAPEEKVLDAFSSASRKRHRKLATPEVWAGGASVEAAHFFDRVRPNANDVPLKYDFPSSVMDDLEI